MIRSFFIFLQLILILVIYSNAKVLADIPENRMNRLFTHHPEGSYFESLSDSAQLGWIKQYVSGFTPAFDFANAITIDATGNVYVTGSSWGANQLPDIVTIKYTPSGDTAWTRRYNGPGNNWDDAQEIVVDAAGNVYITGKTYSDSTFFDFVTIKYDASGNQLWVASYDGPSKNDDGAEDIAVDVSGNVYVTGHSSQTATSWDYATIKYNGSGQQLWVKRYNGPGNIADFAVGIAVDQSGNVFVTGTDDDLSVTHFPAYATVKYNSNGDEQWVRRYQEYWTYAADIDVDASGNVLVTGYSFSSQGSFYDYATVKYNSAGAQQWVKRYNGPGSSDDYATAIEVDASGNVYVTGEAFFMVNNGSDYATIKYSSSGVEQWVARYNGPGSSVDVGNDITLDAQGNVYVTGESRNADGNDDFATLKYNSSGVEQCELRYNGTGKSFDLASAIAVYNGNIYVAGRSNYTGTSIITTIKYLQTPVSVEPNSNVPERFALGQNYPNPFNPETNIKFDLPKGINVVIKVYDITGREISILLNEFKNAGSYTAVFNGSHLASGVYFYRIEAGDPGSGSGQSFVQTKRMLLVK